MFKYDALVYIAVFAVITVFAISAYVIKAIPEADEFETRKLRFAAATFAGILVLILFTSCLYYNESACNVPCSNVSSGAGKDIFEKTITPMLTIASGIIGYLFAANK